MKTNMTIDEMLPSKYLKQSDVDGEPVVTVIALKQMNVARDDETPDYKYIMQFAEFDKPLVLNTTNTKRLFKALGATTDLWIGGKVVLYVDENVEYAGQVTGGLREVDVIAAWSVDRLGRSLQDLVGFLSDLQATKVDLYLHQQALDTSTPSGKAMFGMLGVFAEFERSMIQERVRAGLARARANGRTLGRPKTDAKTEAKILTLAAQGVGKVKIAKTLGIGVSVAQRVLASEQTG